MLFMLNSKQFDIHLIQTIHISYHSFTLYLLYNSDLKFKFITLVELVLRT